MAGDAGPWARARRAAAAAAGAAGDAPAGREGPGGGGAAPPVSHYPCPSCGAMLGYAPGETVLECGFCGTRAPIPGGGAAEAAAARAERDFAAALARVRAGAEGPETEIATVVRCEACGASVTFDPGAHAGVCPFCAAPAVADPCPSRAIRPQAVAPFVLDEAAARAAVTRWLSGLWFAPSGLARLARREGALTGVYAPWWTFDAAGEAAYAGERGDADLVQVREGGRTRAVTRIRWRPASGRVARRFDDVLAVGAASLPKAEAEALGPWDLSDLRPYARDWLAGFRAETYAVGLEDAFADARGRMEAALAADARRAIGGDMQRLRRLDSRFDAVTFKHVLLPVWIGAYRWRGRPYRVLVNGRTGRVAGGRPWSAWKIAGALALALATAAALAWAALAVDGRF